MVHQYILNYAVPYVLASNYWIIIFWVRYSPYTVYAEVIRGQELRLKYGWEMIVTYLYDNLLVEHHKFHFEKHNVCFGSNEPMSRWEAGNKQCRGFPSVLESDSFKDLLETLREIKEEKPNANVLILSVDSLRFGAVPEQHEQIRNKVAEANEKTQFLFLQQAFLDQIPTVIRTYNYLCARASVYNVASQVNPAKSLAGKKWGADAERRIREDAHHHKQQLRQGEGDTVDFITDALALGKQIKERNEAWVEEVKYAFLEAQRNGVTPDEASGIMLRLKKQTIREEKCNLIILRWSSQSKERQSFQEQQKYVTKDGVHCFQAAIGVSLMNDTEVLEKFKVQCCPESRTIVIMDAYKDRTNKSNEGLVFALSLVLGGIVNAIFTPRFNRINNQVFNDTCKAEGVPIIAWDCLGLSIDDYIAEEKTRVTKLENATATKNEEEATAVATTLDNTPGKVIYEELKQLTFGKSSISESLREYVKEEEIECMKFSEQDASLWRKNKSLEEGDDGEDWEDDDSLISAMSEEDEDADYEVQS